METVILTLCLLLRGQICTHYGSLALHVLDAPQEEHHTYTNWHKVDEVVRCYILASISNVLQHWQQHQSMTTTSKMMLNLNKMFGEHG